MDLQKVGIEEFYNEAMFGTLPYEEVAERTTFVTENILMVAIHKQGRLEKVLGTNVKAQSVEMNQVKVQKGDEIMFLELGDNVKWMELEL